MYTATSETITPEEEAKIDPIVHKFELGTGNTESLTVTEPLLDTFDRAFERAESEFVKNGYRRREISFNTYLTNLVKNQLITVYGMIFIVKSLTTKINSASIVTTVKAVRYE